MPQPADPRAQRQATPDPLSDSVLDMQQRGRRFQAEAERIKAEQTEQENHQRRRQERHQEEARRIDDQTRAVLQMRILQAQEGAKPQADVPPVPVYTARQDEELAAEQRRGREMLAKYATKPR